MAHQETALQARQAAWRKAARTKQFRGVKKGLERSAGFRSGPLEDSRTRHYRRDYPGGPATGVKRSPYGPPRDRTSVVSTNVDRVETAPSPRWDAPMGRVRKSK